MTSYGFAIAAARLAAMLAPLAGCGVFGSTSDSRPTARVSGARFERLTPDGVTLVLDAVIENPGPDPLTVAGAEFALAISGIAILEGEVISPASIPAHGEATVGVPISVDFGDVGRTVDGFAPGTLVPYEIHVAFPASSPSGVGESLRIPLLSAGELPAPRAPDVGVSLLRWETLRLDLAAAVVEFRVANPNAFAIDLDRFAFALDLAERTVARGTLAGAGVIDPGGAKTIPVRITFTPAELGAGAFARLQGVNARYSVRGGCRLISSFGEWTARFEGTGEAATR